MTQFAWQILTSRPACVNISYAIRQGLLKRFYSEVSDDASTERRKPHPYRSIHPWRTRTEFTNYLLSNLIHNKDGIVVLNKPYGISAKGGIREGNVERTLPHLVVKCANYTIEDCLPAIADKLGYERLIIGKSPEKYCSGVTILFRDPKFLEYAEVSLRRAMAARHLWRTFWTVTTMIPREVQGKKSLGLKVKQFPDGNKKPVFVHKWSRNDVSEGKIRLMHVEFKVLATSKQNSCSIVEIKTSRTSWHAVRLFAATELMSPVLGDNYHGASIKKVLGAWMPVQQYVNGNEAPPLVNNDLLSKLSLTRAKQELVPAHMHLRSMNLPSLLGKGKHFVVEAPLLHPFHWTCKQLFPKLNLSTLGQMDQDSQPHKLLHEI